jgi:hypothetical protein
MAQPAAGGFPSLLHSGAQFGGAQYGAAEAARAHGGDTEVKKKPVLAVDTCLIITMMMAALVCIIVVWLVFVRLQNGPSPGPLMLQKHALHAVHAVKLGNHGVIHN